jgi:hypothetical protein
MASPLPHKPRTRAREMITRAREMIENREDLARPSPISYSVASNRRSPTAFGHAVPSSAEKARARASRPRRTGRQPSTPAAPP